MYQVYSQEFFYKEQKDKKNKSIEFVKESLSVFLTCRKEELVFSVGKYGKPFLIDPRPVSFSVSHSDDKIAITCSDVFEVGFDLQKKVDYKKGIVNKVFTEFEKSKIKNKDDFFLYWTLKEAALKCIGTGFCFSPKNLEIRLEKEEIFFLQEPDFEESFFLKKIGRLRFHLVKIFPEFSAAIVWNELL